MPFLFIISEFIQVYVERNNFMRVNIGAQTCTHSLGQQRKSLSFKMERFCYLESRKIILKTLLDDFSSSKRIVKVIISHSVFQCK